MTGYKAVLISADGTDYVHDYRADTINGVWALHNSAGPRWYFHPYAFVVIDNGGTPSKRQRIIDSCDDWTHLTGRTVEGAMREIQKEYR